LDVKGGAGLSEDSTLYRFAPPDRDGRFPTGRGDPVRVSERTTRVTGRRFRFHGTARSAVNAVVHRRERDAARW
jgi:hypothetical protein